jgi:putative two-component system response regulator
MYALVLDDSEMNNLLMTEALRPVAGCEAVDFTRPEAALAFAAANAAEIGVVVTDYEMPGLDGIAVIRRLRAMPDLAHVPIVMVTSRTETEVKREALRAGATDFLGKPFDLVEIEARVANLLALSLARRAESDRAAWLAREVAAATATIAAREREIVMLLMRAAEHRDTDTGDHIARVSGYVALIAAAMGLSQAEADRLSLASTMHDVGKIGVPDAILLKRGRLDPEERAEMELHAERGRRILEGGQSDVIRLAAEIAATHHERWDGAGYPNGLSGDAIPLPGRIVAVADVFDALTSERPYKKAWPLDEAKTFLLDNAGGHFDPGCIAAFLSRWDEIARLARAA